MDGSKRSNWMGGRASRGARLAATGLVAIAATIGISAWAHGPGGPGPGGPDMVFAGSPAHVARAVDHLLDGLQASDAQRTQIKQIAQAAAADLKQQRDAGRALHEQGLQLFTAPVVDAGAAETLRAQMETQHDLASRRVLQAMLDVSQVLTPEQRAKIAARMQQRKARMQEHMRHGDHDRPPQ